MELLTTDDRADHGGPMSLQAECPRCSAPIARTPDGWVCPEHGPGWALRRPAEASYQGFAEALALAGDFPTYLPWPMSPGWSVSDFAVVGERTARATMTCSSGTSALDGPVDVIVVSEESGVGLGARCAGTLHIDPGPEMGVGPPTVRVRIGSQSVPLWPVSTSSLDVDLDRSVFAGEAQGRWLWVVLRPASAMLLLRDEWILRDVSGIGPPLVELPFGGPRPTW
jgi:hypothetical protein